MKPLQIELLPAPPAPRWLVALALVLAAAALALGALAGHRYWQLRQLRGELQAQRERRELLVREAQAAAKAPQAPASAPAYEADARKAANEAEFRTAAALTALERVAMVGATPVSVELQAEGNVARVEVEFADYPVLLAYLEALNKGEPTQRWRLLRANAKGTNAGLGLAVIESRW
jgi:hypothetical protein